MRDKILHSLHRGMLGYKLASLPKEIAGATGVEDLCYLQSLWLILQAWECSSIILAGLCYLLAVGIRFWSLRAMTR